MFSTCERLAQSFLNGTVIELDRLPFLGEKCSRAPAWPLMIENAGFRKAMSISVLTRLSDR